MTNTSILDTDLYKLTMGSVVMSAFPDLIATYKFTDRNGTKYTQEFVDELNHRLLQLSFLKLDGSSRDMWNLKYVPTENTERTWLINHTPLPLTYINYLCNYKFNHYNVNVELINGKLDITITGLWYETILWEVALMAIISETYFDVYKKPKDKKWEARMLAKAKKLNKSGCLVSDFGTRRRYSYETQDRLVEIMANECKTFIGTSNPHFAHKYGIPAIGTYAHEAVMGMSALYGPRHANTAWMKLWAEHYKGKLGIALTDTFTTGVFLDAFDSYYARLYDGVRHDSGNPERWADRMLLHYNDLKIPCRDKKFVFSDGLTVDSFIALHEKYKKQVIPIGGIGTHFTNDVGKDVTPLNIVIKLHELKQNGRNIPVVKLSDVMGKASGKPDAVVRIKQELNLL